jgi:hypothetical protein
MASILRSMILASAVGLALSAVPAEAATLTYTADLEAASETPPTTSSGTGMAAVSYDTMSKMLTWTITYKGLTGDATAAHFHGPAAVGAKAPPVVPIKGNLASPITGTATLSDTQAADLASGMWYFNVHTAKYPDGEIRGQILAAK